MTPWSCDEFYNRPQKVLTWFKHVNLKKSWTWQASFQSRHMQMHTALMLVSKYALIVTSPDDKLEKILQLQNMDNSISQNPFVNWPARKIRKIFRLVIHIFELFFGYLILLEHCTIGNLNQVFKTHDALLPNWRHSNFNLGWKKCQSIFFLSSMESVTDFEQKVKIYQESRRRGELDL